MKTNSYLQLGISIEGRRMQNKQKAEEKEGLMENKDSNNSQLLQGICPLCHEKYIFEHGSKCCSKCSPILSDLADTVIINKLYKKCRNQAFHLRAAAIFLSGFYFFYGYSMPHYIAILILIIIIIFLKLGDKLSSIKFEIKKNDSAPME